MPGTEHTKRTGPLKLNLVIGGLLMFVLLASTCALGTFIVFHYYRWNLLPWLIYGVPISITVICFTLRLYAICGFRQLIASIVIFLPLATGVMVIDNHSALSDIETYLMLLVLSAILLLPGSVGIFIGRWLSFRCKSPLSRCAALLTFIILALCIPCGQRLYYKAIVWRSLSHAELMGPPDLQASAHELKQTIVVPTIDYPITPGTNLLWCATFQLAWDELCDYVGENIQYEPKNPTAQLLNKKNVTASDMDPATYVTVAGTAGDGIRKTIQDRLADVFGNAAQTLPLPLTDSMHDDWLITYSYLFVSLPFEWTFERLEHSLDFGTKEVKCFGIDQYMEIQKNERKAAEQILIHDAQGPDNFIVELKTRQKKHHMYLAKVPPCATLEATVTSVQQRITATSPESLEECQSFIVPLLNFDIIRDYNELTDQPITVKDKRFNGQQLEVMQQRIRFRLDERGAILQSLAIGLLGMRQSLIFNKPFLIMLQYEDAQKPYFALWVDNPEVLVEF